MYRIVLVEDNFSLSWLSNSIILGQWFLPGDPLNTLSRFLETPLDHRQILSLKKNFVLLYLYYL